MIGFILGVLFGVFLMIASMMIFGNIDDGGDD